MRVDTFLRGSLSGLMTPVANGVDATQETTRWNVRLKVVEQGNSVRRSTVSGSATLYLKAPAIPEVTPTT